MVRKHYPYLPSCRRRALIAFRLNIGLPEYDAEVLTSDKTHGRQIRETLAEDSPHLAATNR